MPQDRDVMKITILKDGTIKTTTDPISEANHDNAEQFLAAMARLAGGETKRKQRNDSKHEHTHTHEHGRHHHHH